MLIVDTYNALHAWHSLGGGPDEPVGKSSTAPIAMAGLIVRSRYKGVATAMVCDGAMPAGPEPDRPPEGVRVLYAGPGKDADTFIERMIAESHHPWQLVVVSTDRRIRVAAQRRKCTSIASETFLRQLIKDVGAVAGPEGKPGFTRDLPLKEAAMVLWLEIFGYDAQQILDKAAAEQEHKLPTLKIGERTGRIGKKDNAGPLEKHAAQEQAAAKAAQKAADDELKKLLKGSGLDVDPDELDMDDLMRPG